MTKWEELFPYWKELSKDEQQSLQEKSMHVTYKKGMLLHRCDQDCAGIMLILSGQLRTYILSEEGREVTLFRVYKKDICVLSATCLMESIVFDVLIDAVEDTELVLIPSGVLSKLWEKHPKLEIWLYKTATERFSEVMWTMQQILFMGIDRRVAIFLWEEIDRSQSEVIALKHDEIARYIGSAREVVSKVLKYFEQEGVVRLGRGKIEVIDKEKLKKYM